VWEISVEELPVCRQSLGYERPPSLHSPSYSSGGPPPAGVLIGVVAESLAEAARTRTADGDVIQLEIVSRAVPRYCRGVRKTTAATALST
jgi:hypothetical protein